MDRLFRLPFTIIMWAIATAVVIFVVLLIYGMFLGAAEALT